MISAAPVIKEDDYAGIAMCNNGVLELATQELTPYTINNGMVENPDYVKRYGKRAFFWKIVTDWNPAATDQLLIGPDGYEWSVERHFEQVLGNNSAAVRAIWEWYGFALRGISGGRALLLVDASDNAAGGGAKSTTLDIITETIGRENVFFRDLDRAVERFGLAGLIGKRLIVGHENNSHTAIDDSSTLKKLTRGEEAAVEKKGQDIIPYQYRGAIGNAMQRGIKAKEKSSALYRKLMIVPFPARLTAKVERDYIQEDFIKRREVREYVLRKALSNSHGDQFSRDIVDELKQFTREVREGTSPIYKLRLC